MESRMVRVETILPTLATKADVESVRTEIAKLEVDLIDRMGRLESRMAWAALVLLVGMASILVKLFS